MRPFYFAMLLAGVTLHSGATSHGSSGGRAWLAVLGDPEAPGSDSIQVDALLVSIDGNIRRMNVRLNRAKVRTNPLGMTYRSYEAEVEVNCATRAARFTRAQFYNGPLWTVPARFIEYPAHNVRPMEFRLINPNPRKRVIDAACALASHGSGPSEPPSQRRLAE